jgi:hypothetical protein
MFKKRRADAPIISTIMLMAITLFAMSITLSYVNSTLTRRQGENDFESAKIFMKNLGLQIDDVAWTKGRVDTVHFTSQYGQIEYLPDTIQYTITYKNETNTVATQVYKSSIFMFNVPTEKYYLDEGYYESLLPTEVTSLVFYGESAPATRVFAIQKSAVGGNNFLRIVIVPVLRYRNYTVTFTGSTLRYVRIYLPELEQGSASPLPKSVVLTGQSIRTETIQNITGIDVRVDFLRSGALYDNEFFKFPDITQTITFTGISQVETYVGSVKLDYGA